MENGKWKIVLLAFFSWDVNCFLLLDYWMLHAKLYCRIFFCIHISICHHLCRLLHFLGNCEQKMKTEVQP